MRKLCLFVSLAFISLSAGKIIAQECTLYFPSKEGAEMEITHYDAKNKVTGTAKEKIIKKESLANGINKQKA